MKDTLFKIGEMAELNHVSAQTLRLYDRNKLLEPKYMDPETGYRYYTLDQCAKLDLIRALKSCRLPLEKIRRNGMTPCGDYICEVLTQFPLRSSGRLIYKIQVPVQSTETLEQTDHSYF